MAGIQCLTLQSTCVISVVRLATLITSKNLLDVTCLSPQFFCLPQSPLVKSSLISKNHALGDTSYVAIWSTAEPCLGIVAACLPTLRPLLSRFFSPPTSMPASRGSNYATGSSCSTGNSKLLNLRSGNKRPFEHLSDTRDGLPNHTYSASAAVTGESPEELGTKGVPMNAIAVNTSWGNQRVRL